MWQILLYGYKYLSWFMWRFFNFYEKENKKYCVNSCDFFKNANLYYLEDDYHDPNDDKKNLNNMRNNPQYSLNNSLFVLIADLIKCNEGNSQIIIFSFSNSYNNNSSIILTKNVLSPDPFHFLYFLIQFLHIENNMPSNINYDLQILHSQNLNNQRNV